MRDGTQRLGAGRARLVDPGNREQETGILDGRRKEVTVNLVKKLCDGLEMPLGEFFTAPVFDELEQEIRWPPSWDGGHERKGNQRITAFLPLKG